MATKISWADESWNPIIGCKKISAGCANCYAERMAWRLYNITTFGTLNYGHVLLGKQWSGHTRFVESALTKPLHWRNPRKIFVCSMSDLFHESVPFEWIDRIMDVIVKCPQHLFYFLTKRAARQKEYVDEIVSGKRIKHQLFRDRLAIPDAVKNHPNGQPPYKLPPNVHLGVTVENQDNVGRIADLIRTPAAKRFVSFEPLLGDVSPDGRDLEKIDYAFIGSESGAEARLCLLKHIEILMYQCQDVNVKVHIKQIPLNGKCNKNFDEWPEEFQVREV